MTEKQSQLTAHYSAILSLICPNYHSNPELKDTPSRAAKALLEQTSGSQENPFDLCKEAIF